MEPGRVSQEERIIYAGQFETFVRVIIDEQAQPGDTPSLPKGGSSAQPQVLGSRASGKFQWSLLHTLTKDSQQKVFKRTTGDENETTKTSTLAAVDLRGLPPRDPAKKEP